MNEQEHVETSPLELSAKKIKPLWIAVAIVTVLALTAGAVLFFYTATPNDSQQEEKQEGLANVSEECAYASDGEAYNTALENLDEYVCRCIEDTERRAVCNQVVSDNMLMKNAVKLLDEKLCDMIESEEKKQNCHSIVVNAVNEYRELQPEVYAGVRASTHSTDTADEYEKLLAGDPENVEYLLTLAIAYAENGLKEQEQGGDQTPNVEKALQKIEEAKSIDETISEIYRVEGYVYEIQPDLGRALSSYEKAIELDEENALAYAGKGHVERMLGLLGEAITSFQTAANLDVKNEYTNIYTNLCNLEYSRGNTERAEQYCGLVIKQEDADPIFKSSAYQLLALIEMQNNDFMKAESYLTSAINSTPNDANIYVTISRMNVRQGNFSGAEEQARKAISLIPTKADAFLTLSQALYMQERHEESIQAAEEGLQKVDTDVSLLEPAKPVVKRDLYLSISFNYREMGDAEKQAEYESLAEETLSS
jgi:tetratricopeptide (TPR) repeat protein